MRKSELTKIIREELKRFDESAVKSANTDMNVNIRAQLQKIKSAKAAELLNKKKQVYGKQRDNLEWKLIDINNDITSYQSDLKQMYIDMEQELGQIIDTGDEVKLDKAAQRYGGDLDKLGQKIQKLIDKRNDIETKLGY